MQVGLAGMDGPEKCRRQATVAAAATACRRKRTRRRRRGLRIFCRSTGEVWAPFAALLELVVVRRVLLYLESGLVNLGRNRMWRARSMWG